MSGLIDEKGRLTATEVDSFFVYGTLKSGQMNSWLLQPFEIEREPAWTCGQLFDVGAFPAMCHGDGTVHGELVRCRAETMDRALFFVDDLEGYVGENPDSMYLRQMVEVRALDGSTRRALAYFYNSACPALPPLHCLPRLTEGRWDGPSPRESEAGGAGLMRFTHHVENFEPGRDTQRRPSASENGMDRG